MRHYYRKCDSCGKGMDEGYIFNDGMAYACSESCAKTYIVSVDLYPNKEFEELEEAINNGTEWFYWTDWSEDEGNYWEDMHFTAEGEVIISK